MSPAAHGTESIESFYASIGCEVAIGASTHN
jgi:hypothetical protein